MELAARHREPGTPGEEPVDPVDGLVVVGIAPHPVVEQAVGETGEGIAAQKTA